MTSSNRIGYKAGPCLGRCIAACGGAGANPSSIPLDQTPLLDWFEVWKMLGNSLVHLVQFTGKGHEPPPHIPVLVKSKMKRKLGAFLVVLGRVPASTNSRQPAKG